MWSTDGKVVKHPSGKGFAIEVTLKYCNSLYKALIMGIGQTLKAIPRECEMESSLALHFNGLMGYLNAKKALMDVERAFNSGSIGGLWPRCIKCLHFLSVGEGRINTHCDNCDYNNPW